MPKYFKSNVIRPGFLKYQVKKVKSLEMVSITRSLERNYKLSVILTSHGNQSRDLETRIITAILPHINVTTSHKKLFSHAYDMLHIHVTFIYKTIYT